MVLYVMRYSVAITWDIFRLDWNTVEVDGVNTWDAPKFCDAFFSYAEYHDGTPLTDEELDKLTDRHGEELNTYAFENLL